MSTAILKNALSGETLFVHQAKGRVRKGRKLYDIWVDKDGAPLCIIGNEQPNWEVMVLNKNIVKDDNSKIPTYPIGHISR